MPPSLTALHLRVLRDYVARADRAPYGSFLAVPAIRDLAERVANRLAGNYGRLDERDPALVVRVALHLSEKAASLPSAPDEAGQLLTLGHALRHVGDAIRRVVAAEAQLEDRRWRSGTE